MLVAAIDGWNHRSSHHHGPFVRLTAATNGGGLQPCAVAVVVLYGTLMHLTLPSGTSIVASPANLHERPDGSAI